jgi:hypothetical protein
VVGRHATLTDPGEELLEERYGERRTDVLSDAETAECCCPEPCLRDHEHE